MTSLVAPENRARFAARLRGWLPAVFISLLISLAIVLPFSWRGNATGHDFLFHASSWLDAAGQWKHGILFPRWTQWANYGFGEPRFIFYPPFSWLLGAALGMLLPWNAVPVVFVVLVQCFSGVSAFALARRILPPRSALFCVACYVANPYALIIIYIRSDFAELLANAFFPLAFFLALAMCDLVVSPERPTRTQTRRAIAWFAIVLAAVWLSNAPAGVIACYSLAVLFAFAAITQRSWQSVIRGVGGIALGLSVAGFYILPALYEQRWVNIAQALATGLLPSENFLYTAINDPEHTIFNWVASSIAVLMIVLTGLAALWAQRKKTDDQSALERNLWRTLLLLGGVAAFLMLRVSTIFWDVLPKLRYVQFPWRWMALLAVPFAVFLGSAMGRKRWGIIWVAGTFLVVSAASFTLVRQGWWSRADIPFLRNAIAQQIGFDGTDEYDPAGDDHTNVPEKKNPEAQVMDTDSTPGPNVPAKVRVDRWGPEEKEVTVTTRDPFALGLRLLNYPAWQVKVNGTVVTPLNGEDFSQMLVPLKSGESHIQVRFRRTWDRTAGGFLSLCALLTAWWIWILRVESRRPN